MLSLDKKIKLMQKIVVAITGASGAPYAKLLLTKLIENKAQISELMLIMSENAKAVWQQEIGDDSYTDLNVKLIAPNDFFSAPASGSAKIDSMVIIPCSMGTLGRIASGVSNDLITRAADVMLKEKRKLILVAREMPFNLIHIKNMETIPAA